MKMLVLAILLMSFPWLSQAKGWKHSNHDKHYSSRHVDFTFWEKVERRQHRQHERIDRGIDKGQLTTREVRKLKREQKHMAKQIRHLKRHRYLYSSNKRDVMDHLDYVSRQISDLKHNDRTARRGHNHHQKHNGQNYTHYDNKRRIINKRFLSWDNNVNTAGIYFRF